MIIRKALWPALCALGFGTASADAATSEGAPPATSATPSIEYRSVFDDYRAYRDPSIADWRTSNENVGRLKGHAGHMAAPAPGPASGPGDAGAGHSHHGGRR